MLSTRHPRGALRRGTVGAFGAPRINSTNTRSFGGTNVALVWRTCPGLALIVGVGSRVAALGIAAVMLVAIGMVHLPNGFFMNWTGTQGGEGFEYHLLALGLAAIVLVKGGGKGSLDRKLAGNA